MYSQLDTQTTYKTGTFDHFFGRKLENDHEK